MGYHFLSSDFLGKVLRVICGFKNILFWLKICGDQLTTDQAFCIYHVLVKVRECIETLHQLLIHFKEASDSVRREVL
jgi:hypothetical protein